jgi:CzcA family heavy metal efflux pump
LSAGEHGPQAALVRFSIRFRGVVITLAGLLLAYGLVRLQQAKYDVFPEFAPPQVSIQTEAPGMTAEQVEVLVTQPLENSLNGAPGLQRLRSTSIQGLSVITVTFDPGSDIHLDRQFVAERLSEASRRLPLEVHVPSMAPLTSSTSTVLIAGLTSTQRSLMELRTAADWTIRPRLMAVPGVAKVSIFGGDVKSIQIQVRPEQLIRFGLGLNDVIAVAKRATGIRGAGFIDTPNQRLTLQTESQSLTPEDLARTVVLSRGAASVTLGDVADVRLAAEPPVGAAAIDGKPSVQIMISGQYGANTLEVTTRVEAALAELTPILQRDGIQLHGDLFRPANFIETATGNVRESLALGGILVVVVLTLFLFDLQLAAISCLTIPLALLAAIIVLDQFGVTLNTMTLGGLAIAIGVVVDDAVIDIENIVRRLRENRERTLPRPISQVILAACLEVRNAVVYATLAVVLAVLPVLALSGIAGRLFSPLAVAYMLAVFASLLVALTVTPALAMLLLARGAIRADEPPLMRWSKQRYQGWLEQVGRHPRAVLGAALGLIIASVLALPYFGASFIPDLKEGHFIVHMSAVAGTSLAESQRIGALVAKALHEIPAVRSVSQQVGRAEQADDTWGTHYSEFDVDLKPLGGEEGEFVQSDIRKVLARFTGVNFAVKPFLTERVEETLSGFTAEVVVNLYGRDLDSLDASAQGIAQTLASVPGASDVQLQSPPGNPQLGVRLRKADLQRWGLDAVDVLEVIRAAFEGESVGRIHEGNRAFGVTVILESSGRQSLTQVAELPLQTRDGIFVKLSQVADVFATSGRYQVLHQGARRVQTITANVAGRDVGAFVAEAQSRLAKISLPPESYVEFTGEAQAQAQSRRDLLFNSTAAALGIVLLLSIVTRNRNNLLLVLANMPFALVGGVLAVFATGGLLSLGAMVGFLTLFGITLRNSILMIAHYEHLVANEGARWTWSTAVRGATDRLTPILMTSIVTALGVLPLAIGMQEPGREIEGPMAVVILGGLLTSLALNLMVLPLLAVRYGRFDATKGQSAR